MDIKYWNTFCTDGRTACHMLAQLIPYITNPRFLRHSTFWKSSLSSRIVEMVWLSHRIKNPHLLGHSFSMLTVSQRKKTRAQSSKMNLRFWLHRKSQLCTAIDFLLSWGPLCCQLSTRRARPGSRGYMIITNRRALLHFYSTPSSEVRTALTNMN